MKRALIISYNFPPKSGVSSRRWVKLTKGLTLAGVECYVITRNGGKEKGVNWSKDLEHIDNSKIFEIKNYYPRFFEIQSPTLIHRIIKFLGIKLLKRTFFKIDSAQHFYKKLIPKARQILKLGVENIIVSGPPHSLIYHAALLKIENPELNLIIDYRDSWNDEDSYRYKTALKSYSIKFNSIAMERISLEVSDKVLFVTNDMLQRTSKVFSHLKKKFFALHNFYDIDDYLDNPSEKQLMNTVVYFGTLGAQRRKALELIAEAICELKKEGQNFSTKFHFYTNEKPVLFRNSLNYNEIKNHFISHPIVPVDQIGREISKYQICLSINAPNYPHAFGSKIFDYMAMNKNIFHISDEGELYYLLKKSKNLVSRYDPNEIKKSLILIDNNKLNNIKKNYFKDYDLRIKTLDLIKLLK